MVVLTTEYLTWSMLWNRAATNNNNNNKNKNNNNNNNNDNNNTGWWWFSNYNKQWNWCQPSNCGGSNVNGYW